MSAAYNAIEFRLQLVADELSCTLSNVPQQYSLRVIRWAEGWLNRSVAATLIAWAR